MAEIESRTPILAACRECSHVWTAIWTPCPLTRLSELGQIRGCPMCGTTTSGNIVVANRDDVVRYAAWLEDELARAQTDVANG